ncbi:MAG: hypothetical protein VZQ98_02925 [Bacteroidales bacterium]|nr:hypothetical protein [Bacteroidales bacterium]
MEESTYLYIIGPLVTAVIGGVGYLVKYLLSKRDKRHEEEIEERNKRRDEIESRLTKAEHKQEETDKKLSSMIVAIAECEKADCPTRAKLAKLMNVNHIAAEHGEA